VENALSRTHEGTGLGLPLAKALVEKHGGTLRIASERDVGTTVTVTLPASRLLPVEISAVPIRAAG
jgi:signal transduction histidine kinase